MNDPSSGPIRILLVEDSIHDQIAFGRALDKAKLPFTLTVCERAEDMPAAMDAGNGSYDIVVVDYNLPGMNGLEGYKSVLHRTDLPPFVMLTGAGSENLAVSALKSGMADYLIKDPNQGYLHLLPFKLTAVLRHHLERMARLKAQADLKKAHTVLEKIVEVRTAELHRTVRTLRTEIAEREKTEHALRDSEVALRRLSVKIVDTQENERRHMAKDLHDSIGSSLAAIKFAIEGKLANMSGDPPGNIISLEQIIGYIQDTIGEVRRISSWLRPAMLDDMGLLPTMEWFCRSIGQIYRQTRIDTFFDLDEHEIPGFGKIVIYRVMQEAVNNALKHSEADTVTVRLEKSAGGIRLCVTDTGCGFDPPQVLQEIDRSSHPMSGYGLRGMQDRAEVMGGTLTLDSRPGKGTVVCLNMPGRTREPAA